MELPETAPMYRNSTSAPTFETLGTVRRQQGEEAESMGYLKASKLQPIFELQVRNLFVKEPRPQHTTSL